MNSRARVIAALEHREPDHVPFDLGGTHVTGIHREAYRNLCGHLGLAGAPAPLADVYQQIAIPGEQVCDRLQVDTRGLFPLCSHNWDIHPAEQGDYLEHVDEWGLVQRFPKGGYWWSLARSPLDGADVGARQILEYPWPRAAWPGRIAGLREQAVKFRAAGKIVMLKGICAGPFEMGQRLRGMEKFLCDTLAAPEVAGSLLDKITELKLEFWEMALEELGALVDIAVENDDYGTQASQLIAPDTFRGLMKPRLRRIFAAIARKFKDQKPAGERGWIFFHSCGNVRPIIPDLIEIGVDILNPIHVSAAGMAPAGVKRDFGSAIAFWGGGVETQQVLPRGTPAEIRDDVRRNLEALMPGGGFVFNTVHNIQADVPPENIMAMWEAWREYGRY